MKDKISYPWPPILETKRAAEYCGCDVSLLRKARSEGELRAVGRRGGKGPFTFEIIELDRWMSGDLATDGSCGVTECTRLTVRVPDSFWKSDGVGLKRRPLLCEECATQCEKHGIKALTVVGHPVVLL